MSDFDKEAEREKLREKYERDREEREATQRMSDLLLKGATMTNSHCGTCGDPLFQQDGTTFCPSCHGTPDAVEGTDLEARPAAETDDESSATAEEDRPAPTAGDASADSAGAASTEETEPGQRPDVGAGSESPPDRATPSTAADRPARRPPGEDRSRAKPPAESSDADLESVRASLVASAERFARKAAETDDPRYARECLEAAREATEALAALR